MHPNDGRVISNFIVQALCGEDITVYGNGSQTRSFCYVDDLIASLIKLMDSPDEFTGPVNLGTTEEFSILDLAKKVIALTSSKSRIVYKPLPNDDPTQRRPDISLAKEKLGWEPSTDLDKGLKNTIDYFKKLLSEATG
jgi:UDP-glucuronate decarboxylase